MMSTFFNLLFNAVRPQVVEFFPLASHSRNFRKPDNIDILSLVSPSRSGVVGKVARISRAVTAPIPLIPRMTER
jgi:hypothetical protein